MISVSQGGEGDRVVEGNREVKNNRRGDMNTSRTR